MSVDPLLVWSWFIHWCRARGSLLLSTPQNQGNLILLWWNICCSSRLSPNRNSTRVLWLILLIQVCEHTEILYQCYHFTVFILFSGFMPVIIQFLNNVPVLGWILNLPGINKVRLQLQQTPFLGHLLIKYSHFPLR